MHVREVELVFLLVLESLCILCLEIFRSLFFPNVCEVFIKSHHDRSFDICPTNFIAEDISVYGVVVLSFGIDIFWHGKVCRAFGKVGDRDWGSALHTPARM